MKRFKKSGVLITMDQDWLELVFKMEHRLRYRRFLKFRLTHFNVYYLIMMLVSFGVALWCILK